MMKYAKMLDWAALVCAVILASMKVYQMASRKTRSGPALKKTMVAEIATMVFLLGVTIRNVLRHKSWEE